MSSRQRYSATTADCLQRLRLDAAVLERFPGLTVGAAHTLSAELGLSIFEAMVDGEPRYRIMLLDCTWLSVEIRAGRVVRVLGLG